MMAFADQGFEMILPIQAGPRIIGATFPREMWEAEGVQQPRLFGYHLAVTELPDANPSVSSSAVDGSGTDKTLSGRQKNKYQDGANR